MFVKSGAKILINEREKQRLLCFFFAASASIFEIYLKDTYNEVILQFLGMKNSITDFACR